jgi:hypothetical protein
VAALTDHFAFAWGAGRPTAQRDQEMYAVGARWVRFEVEWTNVEPTTKGTLSGWANYDSAIQAAEAAGLKVLPIISTTPTWARVATAPTYAGDAYWKPPALNSNYADFCAAVVNRYKPGGTLGTNVTSYELWNEPNLARFWGGLPSDPAKYAGMISAAYTAMKAAYSSCFVVTGGLSPAGSYGYNAGGNRNPLNYLEGIIAGGAGQKFDAVGWHPYGAAGFADGEPWSAWWQMYGTTPSVRSILTANQRPTVPIWATEYGDSTDAGWGGLPGAITETTAAARLTEAYSRWGAFTFPKGPLFYFTFRSNVGDATGFSIVDPNTGAQRQRYVSYRDAPRDTTGSTGGGGGTTGGSTYSAAVLATTGLQSYWKLGELAGNFADDLGVASLTPSGTIGYNGTSLNAETEGAAVFSGDDTLSGGDIHRFAGNVAHSVELLINPTELTVGTFYVLVSKMNDAATDGWWLLLNNESAAAGPRIILERKAGGVTTGASGYSASIALNTSTRILATYEANTVTISVNGTVIATVILATATIAGSAAAFRVGNHPALSAYKGRIARVAVYNRVVTVGEDATHQAAMTVSPNSTGPNGRPIVDPFNRADEAALASPWTTVSGASGGIALVSNQATGRSAAYGESYRDAQHGPNCEVFATLAVKPAAADPCSLKLGTSITTLTNWNGYELKFTTVDAGTDTIQILRQTGATSTALGATVSQEVTAGDALALSLEGSDVKVYRRAVNTSTWTLLATRTDATHRSMTTALWLSARNQVVRLDDLGGGTFTPAGGTLLGLLGDMASSVAWPTGGTLGDTPSSAAYGSEGYTLGDAPSTANYPPGT